MENLLPWTTAIILSIKSEFRNKSHCHSSDYFQWKSMQFWKSVRRLLSTFLVLLHRVRRHKPPSLYFFFLVVVSYSHFDYENSLRFGRQANMIKLYCSKYQSSFGWHCHHVYWRGYFHSVIESFISLKGCNSIMDSFNLSCTVGRQIISAFKFCIQYY